MILNYINKYSELEVPVLPIEKTPARLKNLFMKYREKLKTNELRHLTNIDSTTISLYIEDGLEQSLKELALRMCFDLDYKFEDVLDFLEQRKDSLFTISKEYSRKYSYIYVYNKWTPGEREPLYMYYANFFKK